MQIWLAKVLTVLKAHTELRVWWPLSVYYIPNCLAVQNNCACNYQPTYLWSMLTPYTDGGFCDFDVPLIHPALGSWASRSLDRSFGIHCSLQFVVSIFFYIISGLNLRLISHSCLIHSLLLPVSWLCWISTWVMIFSCDFTWNSHRLIYWALC